MGASVACNHFHNLGTKLTQLIVDGKKIELSYNLEEKKNQGMALL